MNDGSTMHNRRAALRHALAALEDIGSRADALAQRYGLGHDLDTLSEPTPLAHERPTRQLHGAAAILGASVLADSAVEHYRGSYRNPAMIMPLVSSALTIVSSLHGMRASSVDRHRGRTLAYAAAIGVGALGTGFHLYNVGKRPGGVRWENLFYGAPLGAPAALALSGLSGLAADRLAGNAARHGRPTLLGLPAGRVVAALTSLGLIGTVGEAGLLHFRGNFQNPAMYLPVTMPPIAAALMAEAALKPSHEARRLTRVWLGLTSLMGFAGSVFHAYGVQRMMGGWTNWRQNLLDGPPLPALPSFAGRAVGALAALKLIERHPR